MNFNELIQYKALHLQYITSGSSPDFLLEGLSAEDKKKHFRNVCALIDAPLFERLENTCNFLDISKRQFIVAALHECLDRADAMIEPVTEDMAQRYEAAQTQEVA